MNRGFSFIGAFCALALVGCGGGGKPKGSSDTGSLALSLSGDAGIASGPVGTAQHIVVYRSNGTIVDEQTVNLSSGTTQVKLTNLPSGTLHLHLGLLSSAGAAEVGAVDTLVQGGVALQPMNVVMRQSVSTVAVTSASTTVNVGATQQFYAAGRTTDGSYVYTSSWSWQCSNANATTTQDGLVTGVQQGTVDAIAIHPVSLATASTTLNVLPVGTTQGKWTVMLFLNAANSLFDEAPLNVNQLEKVANNPNVRFVIQWKQKPGLIASGTDWSGTRRYLATYDTSSAIKSALVQDMGQGIDMGSGDTLTNFVDWAKAKYPADHYALIMWDHGSGWYYPRALGGATTRGISLDEETGNLMSPQDVRAALLGRHVDVLAYDACLMQSAEMLFETSTSADYLVGSEDDTPAEGYPYDTLFKPFVDSPDTVPSTLVKNFATAFKGQYGGLSSWAIQQSVVQTSGIADFRTALDNLGLALLNNKASLGTLMTDVRSACGKTDSNNPSAGQDYLYYDLDQLCEQIATKTTNAAVASAANTVRSTLASMVLTSESNTRGAFLRGLSIECSSSSRFNSLYAARYANLQIAGLTHWDEFLKDTTANP